MVLAAQICQAVLHSVRFVNSNLDKRTLSGFLTLDHPLFEKCHVFVTDLGVFWIHEHFFNFCLESHEIWLESRFVLGNVYVVSSKA